VLLLISNVCLFYCFSNSTGLSELTKSILFPIFGICVGSSSTVLPRGPLACGDVGLPTSSLCRRTPKRTVLRFVSAAVARVLIGGVGVVGMFKESTNEFNLMKAPFPFYSYQR